jgi:hypothetical protein
MAPEKAVMTPTDDADRLAELAKTMVQAGARLPRDWPKELRPANPSVEDTHAEGEQDDD